MEHKQPEIYQYNTYVSSYDGDSLRRMRLSSLMKQLQEAGGCQLEALGAGYNRMCDDNLAFVLTRSACVLHRMPMLYEKLCVTTWSRGTKGVSWHRGYAVTDEAGRPVADSVGFFALIDLSTRSLLRPDAADKYAFPHVDRPGNCPDPQKIRLPDELPAVGTRLVRYSDIDYNGHMNNTVYADLLGDFMPGGMANVTPAGFTIDFLKEAREGDEIAVSALREDNVVLFRGEHARGECFRAKVTLR